MDEREPVILKPEGVDAAARARVAPAARPPSSPSAARTRDRPTVYVVGFWRRLLAGLIDAAVILPVGALLCLVVGKLSDLALPATRLSGLDYWLDLALVGDPALWGALTLLLCIGLLYMWMFQGTTGQTLGMRVLGARVVDVYGQRPSLGRAALRALGYALGLASAGLGFFWIGVDREKRGIHDWLAGTYVVYAKRDADKA